MIKMADIEFFIKEKPFMALVTIRRARDDIYGSMISRKIETTYAHTIKIVSKLEEKGLIKSRKDGRKKILELTPKGERYADAFLNLIEVMDEKSDRKSNPKAQGGWNE